MKNENQTMLSFSHAAVGYGEKVVLQDVSFQVKKGEYVALIGSNGTGKSTLIKCVSGLLPLTGGEIEICGKNSKKLKARERAQMVAVVPQSYYVDYDFTVEDIVMMGRNPYIDFRHRESQEDREIAERAMKLTKTDMFRNRLYNQLSGGGIRTVDDFKRLLREGADKISVNSAAIDRPELIREAADKFGSQCVVVAIDAKRREDGGWNIYKHGGRLDTGIDAIEWAKKVEALGAGEILLTSMDCDGTKAGYDIPLTRAVADAVSIPVIASGGAGTLEHFYEGLTEGGADAVLAASLFHYKELEISQVKDYLAGKGVPVRR